MNALGWATDHTHDDLERLTFGCPGCVKRVDGARWNDAPEATVHCRAVVPVYVVRGPHGGQIAWDYTVRARIPVDATPDEILERQIGSDECGVSMPALGHLTDQLRFDALATAIVRVTRIERDAPATNQPPLFGGAA